MKKFFTFVKSASIYLTCGIVSVSAIFCARQYDTMSKNTELVAINTEYIRRHGLDMMRTNYDIRDDTRKIRELALESSFESRIRMKKIARIAILLLEEMSSLNEKARAFQEETEPPQSSGDLLGEINRSQAQEAQENGRNRTAPPERDPFNDFKKAPDEPPTTPPEPPDPTPPPMTFQVDLNLI